MILGIDPGRDKCGVAIVDNNREVKFKEVIETKNFINIVKRLKERYSITKVVLGDGTKSKSFEKLLENLFNKIYIIDESYSTLEARKYYWEEHPPKGWRMLLPLSMQTPLQAIDDYVAVILVCRYLSQNNKNR